MIPLTLLVLAFAAFSNGQVGQSTTLSSGPQSIERGSQPAVDAMREIARTIRECPEAIDIENRWGKGPLEIDRWYMGPPKNVVWDVVPNNTVRSPYMGYIEFSISHHLWVPPETVAKYDRTYPGLRTEAMVRFKDWKLRYEFDIGPAGVELTRALSRQADAKDWSDSSKRDMCWDNVARKGWTPEKK